MSSDRMFPVKVFCIVCLLFWHWGCEKTSEPPKTPKVVSQKIGAESESEKPGRDVAPEAALSESPKTSKRLPKTQSESMPVETGRPKGEDLMGSPFELVRLYDPTGKTDPFEPLIKDEAPQKEQIFEEKLLPQTKKNKRIPRTPLERIDLSQLTLAGIIRSSAGNKALVEEATGKGYIVSVGTYMGINSGRVVSILKDRLVVEEEVENVLGKLTLQKKELKLQKPFGEL
jgi:type IV pilus assembly protein PilP